MLPVPCFHATQTYHFGKMLHTSSEIFSTPSQACRSLLLPLLSPSSGLISLFPPQRNEMEVGGQPQGGWSSRPLIPSVPIPAS